MKNNNQSMIYSCNTAAVRRGMTLGGRILSIDSIMVLKHQAINTHIAD